MKRSQALPIGLLLRLIILGLLLGSVCLGAFGASNPVSQRVADDILRWGLEANRNQSWIEIGLRLEGLETVWYNTAKGDYFRFAQAEVDTLLATGAAAPLKSDSEKALWGHQLLLMYRVTRDSKYYDAAKTMRDQLVDSCSRFGGDSPNKVCTAEAFLAEYASVFDEPEQFTNLTRQFERWEPLVHWPAGDVTNRTPPEARLEPFVLALVDAIPSYPEDDSGRDRLVAMLSRVADMARHHQNASTGLLESSVDAGTHRPMHPSAACLLIYAIAKGVRLGYLPESDQLVALNAWQGLEKYFIHRNDGRSVGTADGSGWPPGPSTGPYFLAAAEMDLAPTATLARGQTVLVDAWYNSQRRENAAGQMESFHYKWSDMSDSGYALLGHIFRSYGAATQTLYVAPVRASLRKAQYYLIVSPDIPVKNPNPHYMAEQDASEIADWVKEGGVLILMENDPPNADLAHLNLLADRFGIHFDDVLHHHILGEHVEDGRIAVEGNGPLFRHPHTFYMKDTCAISVSGPAAALLRDRGDVVMAAAKYGRGTVFAAVDPWLYNEYTDGRNKPEIYNQFDNFAGGQELVRWLLQQHSH